MWEDLRLRADASGEFLSVRAFVELKNARHVVEVEVSNIFAFATGASR